jgi:hypothetical protein
VVVVNDNFSTDTRNNYTDLGVHFNPPRISTDWTVGSGVLTAVAGRNGMLAFENGSGGLLATPDHFPVGFRFTPTIAGQDHPGIAFDRTASQARHFYVRVHEDTAVAATTTPPSNFAATATPLSSTVLNAGSPYDFLFDVNYDTLTATVTASDPVNGNPLATASFVGASFTSAFGANSGGAFGLTGFDTEGATFDNLVVTDFTLTPAAVPEPGSLAIWGLLGMASLLVVWRRRRKSAG